MVTHFTLWALWSLVVALLLPIVLFVRYFWFVLWAVDVVFLWLVL